MINPITLISKYYAPGSKAYELLVVHSQQVAEKAVKIATKLNSRDLDTGFVEEAAMLHDIGIFLTHAPSLGCHGPHPYLKHGHLGYKLLDQVTSELKNYGIDQVDRFLVWHEQFF